MYQLIGIINKFIYGQGGDAADTMARWHNRREYPETDSDEEEEKDLNHLEGDHIDDTDYVPTNLKLVIAISGKRKSGKDHISTLLANYVGHHRLHNFAILRIASPIKKEFALNNKLDFTRLLDSTGYKENFRLAMTEWSERHREKEGWNCFLKQAIKEQRAKHKRIWVLNDARRSCDLEYFDNDPLFENVKVVKLRVEASEEARMSRGWKYIVGIDDRETECSLDFYEDWTLVVENDSNDDRETLFRALEPVFKLIDEALEEPIEESY